MYVLMLNDMRDPNIENLRAMRSSEDRQALVDWHNSLLVEPYMDGRWAKKFAAGSELEWCNASTDLVAESPYFGGVYSFNLPADVDPSMLRISKS